MTACNRCGHAVSFHESTIAEHRYPEHVHRLPDGHTIVGRVDVSMTFANYTRLTIRGECRRHVWNRDARAYDVCPCELYEETLD